MDDKALIAQRLHGVELLQGHFLHAFLDTVPPVAYKHLNLPS